MPCPFRGLLSLLQMRGSAPLYRQGKSWAQGHPSKHPQGACHACLSDHMTSQSWLGASEGSGDSQKGWCLGWVSSDQRDGGRRGGEGQDSQREQQQQRLSCGQHSLESGTVSGLAFFHLTLARRRPLSRCPTFTHLSVSSVAISPKRKVPIPI